MVEILGIELLCQCIIYTLHCCKNTNMNYLNNVFSSFSTRTLKDKKARSDEKNDVVPPLVVTADDQPVMNAENKPVRPISKMGKSNKVGYQPVMNTETQPAGYISKMGRSNRVVYM